MRVNPKVLFMFVSRINVFERLNDTHIFYWKILTIKAGPVNGRPGKHIEYVCVYGNAFYLLCGRDDKLNENTTMCRPMRMGGCVCVCG